MKYFTWLLLGLLLFSCKQREQSEPTETSSEIKVSYAEGFRVINKEGYQVLEISNPWPGADKTFQYALVSGTQTNVPDGTIWDGIVEVPIQKIVVTSTTHIPSLEMLGVGASLRGFPNLDYISSEETRQRIDDGLVKELGQNEDLNTELLIEMDPDAVVTFAVEGSNTSVTTIQKAGIPVIYNSDWTETHPLGKAEWIKFFGVLYGKEKEADSIFNEIETEYLRAKEIAKTASSSPTVLSGAMYKDVWYLPQGDSWAAQFISDANGSYLWSESEGTGSLSLHLEAVLEKGQAAEYWIGPGQFTGIDQLKDAHTVYTEFDAFKNNRIYSFTTLKGATGGVLYYELAPNRPDLVLKDIIKILHPDLLPNYELYFFRPLE